MLICLQTQPPNQSSFTGCGHDILYIVCATIASTTMAPISRVYIIILSEAPRFSWTCSWRKCNVLYHVKNNGLNYLVIVVNFDYEYGILTGSPLLIWNNLLVSFIFAYTGCASFLVTVVQNPRRLKIGSRRLPNLVANVMVVLRVLLWLLSELLWNTKMSEKVNDICLFQNGFKCYPYILSFSNKAEILISKFETYLILVTVIIKDKQVLRKKCVFNTHHNTVLNFNDFK